MIYVLLFVACLTLCSFNSALGIICQECTPDEKTLKACDKPEQLMEVDCDNETFPFNVTEGTKYDSCATTSIVVNLGGQAIPSFVMSCAVKANSSNPSVVNCSIIQDYVCGDARRRASESTGLTAYSVTSCSSVCCTEKSCNAHPTTAAPDNEANGDSSTAASTTVNVNGVSEVQPPCLGLLLVMLAISVTMKEVDEYI